MHRVLAGMRSAGAGSPDSAYTAEVARRLLCGDLAAEIPGARAQAAGIELEIDLDPDGDDSDL